MLGAEPPQRAVLVVEVLGHDPGGARDLNRPSELRETAIAVECALQVVGREAERGALAVACRVDDASLLDRVQPDEVVHLEAARGGLHDERRRLKRPQRPIGLPFVAPE